MQRAQKTAWWVGGHAQQLPSGEVGIKDSTHGAPPALCIIRSLHKKQTHSVFRLIPPDLKPL